MRDTRSDGESLNAASIVILESRHQGWDPSDPRGATRINPLSCVGCDSDSLDASIDINPRIEQVKVERPFALQDDNIPSTSNGIVSSV